jgi:hypothetical protein
MASFEVLGNKVSSGDVVNMEWCPTMDLVALVTSDSQLMVHRPNGWQRLFVHSGFDHPITCLSWRTDGQVLAVGHADGSITLFGVEEGEQMGVVCEHSASLSTFCWVPAASADGRDGAAKDSPYLCSLATLFAPLPQLPKQGSAQQYLLEEGTPALDVREHAHPMVLSEAHALAPWLAPLARYSFLLPHLRLTAPSAGASPACALRFRSLCTNCSSRATRRWPLTLP